MADSSEKATSALDQAKETVITSAETTKTEASSAAAAASHTLTDSLLPHMKEAMDNVLSKGIDGAKTLLHNLEEKKDDVSSKLLEVVAHVTTGGATASGSADSTPNRDLPVSSDNQPLLAKEATTPWWKSCCEILDLLKSSSAK